MADRGKVLVAMSGGVDSSVAAWLLKQQGYECMGATMRLYENETVNVCRGNTCCSLEDVEDARSVARGLGIPYYVFNFTGDFERQVIRRFAAAYEQGRTPNPCIDCNRYLKFDRLYRRARELGCDYIATGHYARIAEDGPSGRWLLKKALDASKDQSYVLYDMTQEQLAHTLLPLGGLTKAEVRAIAEEQGFVNARKHDSQDICFVPDGDYAAFLERYTGKHYPPGDFLNGAGEKLGTHRGIIHYTVGQRKGLGIAADRPLYVRRIDPAANTVTLGENGELFSASLEAEELNLIAVPGLEAPRRVTARVRYHQVEQPALLVQTGEDTARLTFDVPQRAITPGQAVVFYDGDTVLGGGVIR
jgi:tRNA-specific 2-thiouridylase